MTLTIFVAKNYLGESLQKEKKSSLTWYYAIGYTKIGPISEDELPKLQKLYSNAKLTVDLLVWTEGLEKWIPIFQASFRPKKD